MEKIPSFLYGKFNTVKSETSKIISQLKKGIPIDELVAKYELIEISSVPGKLILDGPNPLTGGQEHFNLFTLPRLLLTSRMHIDSQYENLMQNLFNDMMKNFWSHMVLSCGQSVYSFYRSEKNRVDYLKNLLKYRQNYEEVNAYFECLPLISWNLNGALTNNINSIFDHPHFIAQYVLGNLDFVKARFADEEIRNLLVEMKLFECIDKFGVTDYLQKYKAYS